MITQMGNTGLPSLVNAIRIDYVNFSERADRSRYIACTFGRYLSGDVLDVGCDQAVLKTLLDGVHYTGVDIGGAPDLVIDLEKIDHLPFPDARFDTTVCADVLEHLDNLHFVFAELVRVTRNHLVISLPNNWANARRPIERGHGTIAHYGLPAERPRDRHKWFFGLSEALDFLAKQAERYKLSVLEVVVNEKPRTRVIRLLRRLRYPRREYYLNRYAHTVWVVYRRGW